MLDSQAAVVRPAVARLAVPWAACPCLRNGPDSLQRVKSYSPQKQSDVSQLTLYFAHTLFQLDGPSPPLAKYWWSDERDGRLAGSVGECCRL